MKSCIFEGRVKHTRTAPVSHRFSYRVYMMYLDLDELPSLFEKHWFWSASRPALARFRRADHIGNAAEPLDLTVRGLVEERTGRRPDGPIRLLTHLSYFGYCFNPVSFYYCFDRQDETLETVVAEVSNTPWGERTCYVIPAAKGAGGVIRHSPIKKMHVSPFVQMNVDYDWHFNVPAERLSVFMAVSRRGKRFFDASLALKRTEISSASLARVLVTFPAMTARVITAIHWQALLLWLKRCPVYAHPGKKTKIPTQTS